MPTKISKKASAAVAASALALAVAGLYPEPGSSPPPPPAGNSNRVRASAARHALPEPEISREEEPKSLAGAMPSAFQTGPAVTSPLKGGPIFLSSILSRREAVVSFDRLADLRAAGKGSLMLDLNLPEGPVRADFSEVAENHDGGYSLIGAIPKQALSRVVMTVQDEALVADISVNPALEFMILPGAPGKPHELRQINRSILPVCSGQMEVPPAVVSDTAPAEEPVTGADAAENESAEDSAPAGGGDNGGESGAGAVTGPPETTVDVMILYTQDSLDRMQSQAGMIAAMNQAVTDANLVFRNSGVSCALRLAHHQLVDFTPSAMSLDLLKLQKSGDGVLDEALVLKDQYAVDVVSLWHDYVNDSAGVGFLVYSAPMAKSYCFDVVDIDYAVSNRSWVHEVGHNMGMAHDRSNANSNPYRAYAYGWRFTGAGTGKTFGSIMAYPPGQRIPRFSNPDITYDGTATGTATANNAATAVATKGFVSDSRIPVPLVITQQPQPVTITLGQSATLSVTATGSAPVYQWFNVTGAAAVAISGANNPTLTVTPTANSSYRCLLQNGAGMAYSYPGIVQVN